MASVRRRCDLQVHWQASQWQRGHRQALSLHCWVPPLWESCPLRVNQSTKGAEEDVGLMMPSASLLSLRLTKGAHRQYYRGCSQEKINQYHWQRLSFCPLMPLGKHRDTWRPWAHTQHTHFFTFALTKTPTTLKIFRRRRWTVCGLCVDAD